MAFPEQMLPAPKTVIRMLAQVIGLKICFWPNTPNHEIFI